jgi:hypothetical protein
MQSNNYTIQSDSINMAGGFASSSNYTLESTAGEVATGVSDSTNYRLKAGYQQMNDVYIALSAASDVSLTPSIPGVAGGTSNGTTSVLVTTDSPSGYSLSIAAATNPAMQKGVDSIADYVPTGDPDFTFITGSTDSHFGFTPQSSDLVQKFKDNGSVCNGVGTLDTAASCWAGLSTSGEIISSRTSSNHPSGATTTILFKVGVGSLVSPVPGVYVATTTLTALPL